MRMRRKAVRALASHTGNAIRDLRNDEDEMLRGAHPELHATLPSVLAGQQDEDAECAVTGTYGNGQEQVLVQAR